MRHLSNTRIQYSIDRLIAKFQELSNHILDSKLVKGVVDFGTTTLDVIDKATSALTPLGTFALGGGLFAGIKNVGGLKMQSLIVLNSQQQYVFFRILKFSHCQ